MEKRRATIGDATIVYARAGSGHPAIVLLNGAGGPLDAWRWIWPDLAAQTMLVAYNRPGIDGSSKPTSPQTSDAIVAALRALLQQLNIAPPYLLVAHSLGGLHASYFARRHPGEVAAIVYLEAAAPEDIGLMATHKGPIVRTLERITNAIAPPDSHAETSCVERSVALIEAAGPIPAIPITVITGARNTGGPKPARKGRARNQAALAAASPCGRHIIAERSGHFPQISEPKLVVDAIVETLAATRS